MGDPRQGRQALASLRDAALAFERIGDSLNLTQWFQSLSFQRGAARLRQEVRNYARQAPAASFRYDVAGFAADVQEPQRAQDQLDTLWLLTLGMPFNAEDRVDYVRHGLRIVFGVDTTSTAARTKLLPEPRPSPLPLPFPGLEGALDKFEKARCYGAFMGALQTLGAAGLGRERAEPYPGFLIQSIEPRRACPLERVRILGSGFGPAAPQDARVVFDNLVATVASWSDTTIEVIVPAGAGECCVSILRSTPAQPQAPTLAEAASEMAGVLSSCFGAVGAAASIKWELLGARLPDPLVAVCAADGSNRFIGGPPRITRFASPLGMAARHSLRPGVPLRVEWAISNADSARLTLRPQTPSPYAALPSLPSWFTPNPVSGSIDVPYHAGLLPWSVEVELAATNRCGTTRQTLSFEWEPAVGVVCVGSGQRSVYHLGALEALAALLPTPPKVFAGSGIGAVSMACAWAQYPATTALEAFWARADTEDWFIPNTAIYNPNGDRQAAGAAIWQAAARSEVLCHASLALARYFIGPRTAGDKRDAEMVAAKLSQMAADKIMDTLADAVKESLTQATNAVVGSIPIVTIVYQAVLFAYRAYEDSLKQNTRDALAVQPALFTASALMASLTQVAADLQAATPTAGRKLRLPLVSFEGGTTHYATEGAAVSEVPVGSNIVANSNLGTVLQAAASTPLIAPPVRIGSHTFMDGGIRHAAPIGAAIEAGAASVIVVNPVVRLMRGAAIPQALTPSGLPGIPQIDARATLLRDAEFLEAQLEPFGHFAADAATGMPVGAWRAATYLVEPRSDIALLASMFGQPALRAIHRDHGYMNTFDALVPALLMPLPAQQAARRQLVNALQASTLEIVALRMEAWEREHLLNGFRPTLAGPTIRATPLLQGVPSLGELQEVRRLKRAIHAAVEARLRIVPQRTAAMSLPTLRVAAVPAARALTWISQWEAHPETMFTVSPVSPSPAQPFGHPWMSFTDQRGGTPWPAEAAPVIDPSLLP